jgi:predicted secreted hydrolase
MTWLVRHYHWLALGLLLAVFYLYALERGTPDTQSDLSGVLSGESEGFARAEQPRAFVFPSDHGPHPDFRNEWWYITAHLHDQDGQVFTLMLTFFRFGLAAEPASTDWGSPQLYMAHYALLDLAQQRHYHGERLQRAAHGLAGASRRPYRVWLNDWQLSGSEQDLWPAQLSLRTEDFDLQLELTPQKAPVLQGDAGLSRKSADPGNASYYYSYTRLAASGDIQLGGQSHTLQGQAWMDREFGSSALAGDQLGWDWFSLQLDNQQELMIYQMRLRDGGVDPSSHGVWVQADGSSQALKQDDYQLTVLEHWTSDDGSRRYPSRWRLSVPSINTELNIEPLYPDQEMRDTRFRYYEGAVQAQGQHGNDDVRAKGFVEMTGYGPRQ